MLTLNLGADALLSTTRAVRRRLDFDRDVEPEVIEECVRLAQQAPSAYGTEIAHFLVVTDPANKAALAELWRRGRPAGRELPILELRAAQAILRPAA
jgi:nitroreductase